jgi:hypothetical protein
MNVEAVMAATARAWPYQALRLTFQAKPAVTNDSLDGRVSGAFDGPHTGIKMWLSARASGLIFGHAISICSCLGSHGPR